jgi:ubiquinone/menaquinone biosynthesis C-methylase UbiE
MAVWGASPAGTTHSGTGLDGSEAAFSHARRARNELELPWISELIPFPELGGRDVVEIGCGAGFDAVEFLTHGARYVGIDLVPTNVDLASRHLAAYGFTPQLLVADAEYLPFAEESFDVAFSNGVLHHTPDISRALAEVRRVLRPGGEFYVSLYHKTSVFYWLTLYLEHWVLRGDNRRLGTFADRVAEIEFTSSSVRPLVNVYTKGEVRRLLETAGFQVSRIWVRKLTVDDLPTLPLLRRLGRLLPKSLLNAVGKRFGWYVIARAVRHD